MKHRRISKKSLENVIRIYNFDSTEKMSYVKDIDGIRLYTGRNMKHFTESNCISQAYWFVSKQIT